MKIIANLGKLDDQRTALIIDNKIFPFYIVNGWNGEMEGDDLWAWTVGYYDNVFKFAKAITNYSEEGIGWDRMSEIASKTIDGLIQDDPYEAEIYLKEEVEMTLEEAEYFGVTQQLDMEKEAMEDD